MPYITKQFKFCAAHRYWNDNWSKEKNKEIFGKDIHIHGHNYSLFIKIILTHIKNRYNIFIVTLF